MHRHPTFKTGAVIRYTNTDMSESTLVVEGTCLHADGRSGMCWGEHYILRDMTRTGGVVYSMPVDPSGFWPGVFVVLEEP